MQLQPIHRFLTCLVLLAFGGQLSAQSVPTNSLLRPTKTSKKLGTERAESTQSLKLDRNEFEHIRGHRFDLKTLALPFPELGWAELEVQEFCNLSDDFIISRSTTEGTKLEHYTPSLITYEVRSAKLNGKRLSDKVTGTLVVFDHYLQASIQLSGKQWELAPAMRPEKRETLVEEYVLFDVAKSAATNTFTCAVEDQEREMQRMGASQRNSLVPQCVEIGLDVDNFTYNTFEDCYQAIDWALGVLAGRFGVPNGTQRFHHLASLVRQCLGNPGAVGQHCQRCRHDAGSTSRRMGLLQSCAVQCQLGPCPFDVQARRHWNRRHCLPRCGLQP